mmetsp:Transcript_13721/g.16504  ORF Transcript_13721/g.16504 Transcript_13721/m.16504 type:complete len:474 (+) Transcript_13721:257-1678(+)|eukprot:CAMPEP_0197847302 /NCGR_PEP_ID=MMETSP1438-20131217/5698_1 /TAXON_ID=1461541 /ORGANISM="Pterosperma sp., Strain CCMP1384" /LENGTH=473 /DNA_ID=CAMNT_0043459177 /DNA_START=243 /DNA_END=1664 /DNA_ORIENTATION=-
MNGYVPNRGCPDVDVCYRRLHTKLFDGDMQDFLIQVHHNKACGEWKFCTVETNRATAFQTRRQIPLRNPRSEKCAHTMIAMLEATLRTEGFYSYDPLSRSFPDSPSEDSFSSVSMGRLLTSPGNLRRRVFSYPTHAYDTFDYPSCQPEYEDDFLEDYQGFFDEDRLLTDNRSLSAEQQLTDLLYQDCQSVQDLQEKEYMRAPKAENDLHKPYTGGSSLSGEADFPSRAMDLLPRETEDTSQWDSPEFFSDTHTSEQSQECSMSSYPVTDHTNCLEPTGNSGSNAKTGEFGGKQSKSSPIKVAKSKTTIETISKYFHLPINEAAQELNVCATVLKKICRKHGMARWPHRKLKSIEKIISNLKGPVASSISDVEDVTIVKEIATLENEKKRICLQSKTGEKRKAVPVALTVNIEPEVQVQVKDTKPDFECCSLREASNAASSNKEAYTDVDLTAPVSCESILTDDMKVELNDVKV